MIPREEGEAEAGEELQESQMGVTARCAREEHSTQARNKKPCFKHIPMMF